MLTAVGFSDSNTLFSVAKSLNPESSKKSRIQIFQEKKALSVCFARSYCNCAISFWAASNLSSVDKAGVQ